MECKPGKSSANPAWSCNKVKRLGLHPWLHSVPGHRQSRRRVSSVRQLSGAETDPDGADHSPKPLGSKSSLGGRAASAHPYLYSRSVLSFMRAVRLSISHSLMKCPDELPLPPHSTRVQSEQSGRLVLNLP